MTQCGSGLFCLQWQLHLCQWVNSTCLNVPTSWIPLNYLETERNLHLSLRLLCLQSAANKNHHCQCKQMHGNYFRITTALCHLTAVSRPDWLKVVISWHNLTGSFFQSSRLSTSLGLRHCTLLTIVLRFRLSRPLQFKLWVFKLIVGTVLCDYNRHVWTADSPLEMEQRYNRAYFIGIGTERGLQ